MQNKRLRLKLKSYDDLIMKLRNKNLISENASYHLQVWSILNFKHNQIIASTMFVLYLNVIFNY